MQMQYQSKNKRGQVTLFVVIAILIVAIFALIFLLRGNIFKTRLSETEIANVKENILACFENKLKEGLLLIGKQAGYYDLPQESINFLEEKTAYYWKDNRELIPSIAVIEQQIKLMLSDKEDECFFIGDYKINKEGNCEIDVNINDKVKVNFDCPVTIKKGNAIYKLEKFEINENINIIKLLNVSKEIVDEYSKNPGYLCVSCFDNIALSNNVTVKIVPITKEIFEPEHVWFLIKDKNLNLNNINLTWRFVTEL